MGSDADPAEGYRAVTLRIAVLGAGALGLTAAMRLASKGHRVTIIEREQLPGGLAAGFEIEPGIWLEKFYHHLFRSDASAIAMLAELKVSERLEWHAPLTTTLREGRLHQLDSPSALLRFSPLKLVSRLRMGMTLAALKAMPNPQLLEGHTAASWLETWMGSDAYATVWEPLLLAKFGSAAPEIGMPWFWARVHDRTQHLGYLRGGFQQMYERMAIRVRTSGGEVRFAETVTRIGTRDGGSLEVATDNGAESFDRVLSTVPNRVTARLAPGLPESWRDRFEWGRAIGAHCLILALNRPLSSAYWINVSDPGFPFMAVVEQTNLVSPSDYGGRHLIYVGNYRPMDDPLMAATKDAVVAQFADHLARINPSFETSWIRQSWMFAAPFAQPIVTVDYRDHIPPFHTPVPGLFVANMFQVYPHDRGQNYSIKLAERVAARLA
jgi:protoporphyrinogen oxidase